MRILRANHDQRRRGTALVVTCASAIPILFLTALAIDGGNLMATRRHMQNCADAAALAGNIQIATLNAQGTTPTLKNVQDAVYNSASNNGYVNGTNCTITVNWPPTSGNFKDTNSVEIYFNFNRSNSIVTGSNSVTVRSVASCDSSGAASQSMLILDPTGSKAFDVNGGKLTLTGTSIQVNSNSSTAAVVEGQSGSTIAAKVQAVGGSTGSFTPAAKSGGNPIPDPYALVPTPTTTGMTTYSQSTYTPNGSGNITLNPGYYPNGIYISSGNVTLNPGLYYIANGNVWINTPGSVSGTGVTMYHAGANSTGQLQQDFGLNVDFCFCMTNNNYTITAPTTGPYAGISLMSSRTSTNEQFYDFWGTGTMNVGLQYFPNSTLRTWSTGTGQMACNELVCKDFKLLGTHEIYGNTQNGGFSTLTWTATRSANRPSTSVYLAE